jgi:hypothetical protein
LFSRLTDYYGNIPYFEAIQAQEGVLFPKYDKQSTIYTDLLKELDEASAALKPVDPTDPISAAEGALLALLTFITRAMLPDGKDGVTRSCYVWRCGFQT